MGRVPYFLNLFLLWRVWGSFVCAGEPPIPSYGLQLSHNWYADIQNAIFASSVGGGARFGMQI